MAPLEDASSAPPSSFNKRTLDARILAIQFLPLMTLMYDAPKQFEVEPDIPLDTSNWRAVPNHSRASSGLALRTGLLWIARRQQLDRMRNMRSCHALVYPGFHALKPTLAPSLTLHRARNDFSNTGPRFGTDVVHDARPLKVLQERLTIFDTSGWDFDHIVGMAGGEILRGGTLLQGQGRTPKREQSTEDRPGTPANDVSSRPDECVVSPTAM